MTREAFIRELRAGLSGLSPAAIADLVSDYEAHFSEGAAAGRSETEVAAALGDPARLARELRVEAGLRRWEAERNPSAAASAVFAVLGLGAIDILILLPILLTIGGVLMGLFMAALACMVVGAAMLVAGPFVIHGGPVGAILLMGLGLVSLAATLGALSTLATLALMNALVWYGRLHMRLLSPALHPQGVAA